ncbi:MAG: uroporphyrinogen-III synthase [Niabella sp.]
MTDAERKILSTRVLEPAIISEAGKKGVLIDCISFIDIHYRSAADIRQQLGNIASGDVFIFTSQHAVQAAFEVLRGLKNTTYCIDGATYNAIKQTELQVAATASYASELVVLIDKNPGSRYILFCGDKRLPTIPDFLHKHKLPMLEVICYENIATPQKVEQHYDGIMFYSPTGVESYFSANEVKDQTCYCIGTTTANAVKKYTRENIVTASRPGIGAMLEKIYG